MLGFHCLFFRFAHWIEHQPHGQILENGSLAWFLLKDLDSFLRRRVLAHAIVGTVAMPLLSLETAAGTL